MATKTVLVTITTKPQSFPLGTVEGKFKFELLRASDNFQLSFVDTDATGASFPGVPAGDYIAKVSKNGVVVSLPFNVAKTDETFQIPDVLSISIS